DRVAIVGGHHIEVGDVEGHRAHRGVSGQQVLGGEQVWRRGHESILRLVDSSIITTAALSCPFPLPWTPCREIVLRARVTSTPLHGACRTSVSSRARRTTPSTRWAGSRSSF